MSPNSVLSSVAGGGNLALCPTAIWKHPGTSCHRGGATRGPSRSVTAVEKPRMDGRLEDQAQAWPLAVSLFETPFTSSVEALQFQPKRQREK